MLGTEGVGVHFGGLKALEDVTFGVAHNEIVGLLGPNGAGKTTLLNVLSGFQAPSEGVVALDGRRIDRWPPHRRARRGIARTFQAVRPFPNLSVRDNVLVAALTGSSRRDSTRLCDDILARFELVDIAGNLAGTLNYAQERLVGLARALVLRPRFLLLDEPAAGTTDVEAAELAERIRAIPDEFGCAVVVVEHNIGVVATTCRRVHVLAEGRTLVAGAWDDVKRDDVFIRAYLGTEA